MDHARHLSSPSPNSFLFQHSERSFKSDLLAPSLLTSDTDVDDCFSTSSGATSQHHSHHDQANDHHEQDQIENAFGDTNDIDEHEQTILVSEEDHQHDPVSHIDSNLNNSNNKEIHQRHEQQSQHQEGQQQQQNLNKTGEWVIIDRDSLDGVDDVDEDDVDGMHNMLSGSSTSSTATMPLLSDSHSHNPFTRISLEEYSPLSLVDECDQSLAISPTSLTCGSHHPFKTSLNNLKIDNLDGVVDVGVHDHDDHVVSAVDARSISPTLLSATSNALHHHLWSSSSTAITQNPALLSGTPFLLSHHNHHHHQLNTLMQQLEPQSLDEPPPLPTGSSLDFDQNILSHHRPSSEPPPGCGLDSSINNISSIEIKSVSSQSNASTIVLDQVPGSTARSKGAASKSKSEAQQLPSTSATANSSPSSRSSRRNRSRAASSSSTAKHQASSSTLSASLVTSNGKAASERGGDKQQLQAAAGASMTPAETAHSSKIHLQLNHHQKLKELQQRLFGTTATTDTNVSTLQITIAHKQEANSNNNAGEFGGQYSSQTSASYSTASSSSSSLSSSSSSSSSSAASTCFRATPKSRALKRGEEADSSAVQTEQPFEEQTSKTTTTVSRVRTTPKRKSRAAKIEASDTSAATTSSATSHSNKSSRANKIIATETAEPDTTTKTADCVKLADLLATTNSSDTKGAQNINMMLSNVFSMDTTDIVYDQNNNNNDSDKRIQHIQLQVSPSLTVMSNGSLIQPISIQQQQQLQSNNGTTVVCTGSVDNQLLCRPITVMATTSAAGNISGLNGTQQLKCNLIATSDTGKNVDAMPLYANNIQLANNGTTTGNNNFNTHQIAIQVICQDGTSLVLPVSSSTTPNGLSLAPQNHQQLQAILGTSNANQQSRNNILPLVSVANIVAQQQQHQTTTTTNDINNGPNTSSSSLNQNGTTANNATQTSGLAASSPTLAALLDAGSTRNNNGIALCASNLSDMNASSPQSIVSTNLLRKLIGGNQANLELKRGELGAQINLTGQASLVTLCSSNPSNGLVLNSNNKTINSNTCTNSDKRIKQDSSQGAELGNGTAHTTYTLIEPQGLMVTNGNDASSGGGVKQPQAIGQVELPLTKATLLRGQLMANNNDKRANNNVSGLSSLQQQLNSAPNKGAVITTTAEAMPSKQCKMTSSTGNRQVDPTQPFRCEHCNSTFTRLGNFTRHKKIHTVPIKDGQRFKCDVCSKSFLQRCDLARHLHIHRGTEPHRCDICGKGYIRHSDLVTHQRFHNKEKPFGCPHCPKGFCQRGDLNRHLRSIHLQMKPILCPCCNRKFAKQETLLRHLNTAHRGRPGGLEMAGSANYSIAQGEDKQQQAIISLVANTPVLNGTNSNSTVNVVEQKAVASLQAIQATLSKVQQTTDPSIAVKLEVPTSGAEVDSEEVAMMM